MRYLTKRDTIWLVLTILLSILISLIQMYSRDITLDKVHRTEFNLIYKLFNDNPLDRPNIQSILYPLLTKHNFALFQVAIVSKNSCFENTTHYYNRPLLCSTFSNFDNLNLYTTFTEFETSNILEEKTSESYLIKKFNNSNEYLLAKTNFYSKNSEFSHFRYFLIHRYYQTNGYKKIFEKGEFLFITIFLISFIIWFLNKLQYENYRKKYQEYIDKEKDLESKLYDVDTEYNNMKRKKYENEIMLEDSQVKLKNMYFKSDIEKKELLKKIDDLTMGQKELEQLFKEDEDLIEILERERIELRKTLHLKLKKLELYEQNKNNDLIYEKLEKLEKLWRHEPSWIERKDIESLVALKDAHLPFTITQGFIAFDKLVLKLVKQYNPEIIESQTNLMNNINIIFKNGFLPLKYEQNFHDIRKARNEWFHAGIYPKLETIDFLVTTLEDTDADVFI